MGASRWGAALSVIVAAALVGSDAIELPRAPLAPSGPLAPDEGVEIAAVADERRDPVFLTAPETQGTMRNTREIRFEGGKRPPVLLVEDALTSGAADLAVALPAVPQDFALMGAVAASDVAPSNWEQEGGETSDVGTSTLLVLPRERRAPTGRDRITKVLGAKNLADVLAAEVGGRAATEAALQLLELDALPEGAVVARRSDRVGASTGLVQLSVYGPDGALGAIGRGPGGGFARIEDPWADEGLAAYTGEAGEGPALRLMDGLYAAGVRNGVPPAVVSEAIVQLARSHDLGQVAGPGDRFRLLYSPDPRDAERGTGHVLYAALQHGTDTLRCYVLKPTRKDDYTCMTERDEVAVSAGPAGFVTPVSGVLRSRFGPRRHPILKRTRMHNGVDWAAPSGTPIKAAFAGTVTYRGVRGGYGNYVKLRHDRGLESAYAHMSRFAAGLREGSRVAAGEVIGYVGSTGLSTGPHLHFELHANGRPVDPLGFRVPERAPVMAGNAPSGRGEIDKLIARIIHVESAGRADARNPRSTATGLGQFIDSTWLRMMRTYRPDLARSMGRRRLLSLRTDPSIAREMVYRLAAENRASLRRAGLPATAGNLYLCHFLGPGGAIQVLRAHPSTPLVNVVGRGVINANPFLRGQSADWVVRWAARKMGRPAPRRAYIAQMPQLPPPATVKNSRFEAYSEAVDALLESAGAAS